MDTICTYDGQCEKPVFRRKLCRSHWELTPRKSKQLNKCGHPERPHSGNGMCRSCYMMDWMKKNPKANSGNNWSANNPERARLNLRRFHLKKHGITLEDYEQLWIGQEGKCANPQCGIWFALTLDDYREGLQIDHNHTTGKIRGLLCGSCNRALGHAKDDIKRLRGLIEYLQAVEES